MLIIRAIQQQMTYMTFPLSRDLLGSLPSFFLHDVVRSLCEEGRNVGARCSPLPGLGV
jgi:hypothetical protein